MKNFKNLILAVLAVSALGLSGCLHILEEATFNKNGSGSYKMTLDLSEVKGMMDMFKTMAPDSTGADSTGIAEDPMSAISGAGSNPMGQMGEQLSTVASTLKSVAGITDVVELNDTTNLQFGYSFNFANIAALNTALKVIMKEKYDSKAGDVFKFTKKGFERVSTADMGEELKKALSESGGEEGQAEMMKMFFADMTYKQVYNFPDQTVKKSTNELSEVSEDKHTLSITLKPFDEEQAKKKITVGTAVKLK